MENPDLSFIRAILNNDPRVLELMYRKFLPPVFGMLRRNGGTFEDAKDVFQEAIVVVFHHAAKPGFQLSAPFQSYLMGISRFIWLRQLKKNARTEVTFELDDGLDITADLEAKIFESEKQALYRDKFSLLGPDCQQLLQRFFNREPLGTIARSMGYTDDYVKKKNKVCKEKLMELIQKDLRFKELSTAVPTPKTQTVSNGA